jgi:hypothetical protein
VIKDYEGYTSTDDQLRLYFHVLGDGPLPLVVPAACLFIDDLRPLAGVRRPIISQPLRGSHAAADR